MVILSNKTMKNHQKKYPQKGVKKSLPWFCCNGEQLIPIYVGGEGYHISNGGGL